MSGFKPFFPTSDKDGTTELVNLMSVGKVSVKKDQDGGKNKWTVTMTAYPGGNTITLDGENAEKFVEEYTQIPTGKSYL
jgi:hypothetical protein